MTPFQYAPYDYDIFLGVDVDKKSFAMTIKDRLQFHKTLTMPSRPEGLRQYIQRHFPGKRVLCGYEAGPTGYHLYRYLTRYHQPCAVIAPSSLPKAGNERVKNNRIDSEKLAAHLRSGELTFVRVPSPPYQELRHLTEMYECCAQARQKAKQRIKSLLLFENLPEEPKDPAGAWSVRYMEHLKELECSPIVRERLNMLLSDLAYAREQILSVVKKIKSFAKGHKNIQTSLGYLRSIPGIGFITASLLLGRLGDPEHLRDPREIASFLGLVPTERSTGARVDRGRITHLGDSFVRSRLVECAWVAIRYDKELEQFYYRIKSRHHPQIAANKAIVAVARKMTQRIYRVLKDQRPYLVH